MRSDWDRYWTVDIPDQLTVDYTEDVAAPDRRATALYMQGLEPYLASDYRLSDRSMRHRDLPAVGAPVGFAVRCGPLTGRPLVLGGTFLGIWVHYGARQTPCALILRSDGFWVPLLRDLHVLRAVSVAA